MYDHLNAEERLAVPLAAGKSLAWTDVNKKLTEKLLPYKGKSEKVALVLTPQYTNEEYQVIFETLKNVIGAQFKTYVWRDPNEKLNDFDGILFRGDRNPNTAGLKQILENQSANAVSLGDSFAPLAEQQADVVFVFGPEIEKSYTQFANEMNRFAELPNVIYFGSSKSLATKKFSLVIPTKVFAEKNGTFVNYNGVNQKLKANPPVFPAMLGIEDIFSAIKI